MLATTRAENERLSRASSTRSERPSPLDRLVRAPARRACAIWPPSPPASFDEEDMGATLADAILALIGEELLASRRDLGRRPGRAAATRHNLNDNARPIATTARLGECAVDCTWQPGANAGKDTANVVEGLCAAVVCSLAAVTTARAKRDVVTQLADERSLNRHLALRERHEPPREHRARRRGQQKRDGAPRAVRPPRVVRRPRRRGGGARTGRDHNGGQAYQASETSFHLLIDADRAEQAHEHAETALADNDGLIFQVTLDRAVIVKAAITNKTTRDVSGQDRDFRPCRGPRERLDPGRARIPARPPRAPAPDRKVLLLRGPALRLQAPRGTVHLPARPVPLQGVQLKDGDTPGVLLLIGAKPRAMGRHRRGRLALPPLVRAVREDIGPARHEHARDDHRALGPHAPAARRAGQRHDRPMEHLNKIRAFLAQEHGRSSPSQSQA